MIWSTPPEQIEGFRTLLGSAQAQQTTMLSAELTESGYRHEPVDYFEIPPVAHTLAKLVVAYAYIGPTGHLSPEPQPFYAVTKRPSDAGMDTPAVTRRLQQGHVLAEDISLRRGIFTIGARAESEVLVARLIPEVYRSTYVHDRIVHLGALATEASESNLLARDQRKLAVTILGRGIDALQDRLD